MRDRGGLGAANSARMAVSDDFSETLAELSCAIVEQHVRRNLTWSHGLPRRQVCLLDPALAPGFISQLQKDLAIHDKTKELHFEGVEAYLQRSVFNHMSVRQLAGCLQEESWEATPRFPRVTNSQTRSCSFDLVAAFQF